MSPARVPVAATDPPLAPTPDEARDLLRRELVDPAYYEDNLVQRLLDWISRRLDGLVESSSGVPPVTWLAATAVALGLLVALALLVSRARGSARSRRERPGVLTDEQVTAAELRARAERALAEGRHEAAVVEGFRALALAEVERGRLDLGPGATAHEVAAHLAADHPGQAGGLTAGADLFDAVLYGRRPATRDHAALVLGLDRALEGQR